MTKPPEIHVAAGAIFNDRGEVLLALRHDDAHQGGLWEFPGGKVEPGEDVRQALERELREELDLVVEAARPLIRIRHAYKDRTVVLDVWRITRFSGSPVGLEGQRLEWVAPEQLGEWAMPEADVPIINAVRLPEFYLITGNAGADDWMERLAQRLDHGIRLVQLRAKSLSPEDYRQLAQQAIPLCHSRGARVLLNADPALAAAMGADGVHLSSERLMALDARPLPPAYWIGASCHGVAELRQAERLGANFAVLSPVLPTPSHPQAPPMGWQMFQTLAREASVPVYALGGMRINDADTACWHGGQGIAGITCLWGDDA